MSPTMKNSALLALIVITTLGTMTNGFMQAFTKSSAKAISPKLEQEAVQIYQKKYPKKAPFKPFFQEWGLPPKDIDGTEVRKSTPGGTAVTKTIYDVEEKQQREAFRELSRLYGGDEALQMTIVQPGILAFDKANFAPSLKAYCDVFGEDEAKGMIARNPGLLAVKPADAAGSDDTTMKFSYVLAATRPVGQYGVYGLLALLSLPVIEGISGVPFRANLINEILSK
mmetsp:Transcript_61157/g.72610  ORF Transcript_61157/g.72610 Transcript_61157/m.72610 type:complete len:226 (+) Transcript_61157:71-748(+)|eukprot:CAMPEP_0172480148 /NCGR_PEP_ID=MMETSP1066-20121228/5120_1 /TAXON_ID=671091 /ORGANISM="Coscinodiscus wailesii, Strain CCMP2513" /LENGTH=225 /DNA_ID=CAMNT_0013241211 /DNA_START=79 /DNA_END=756 /DNA_ORIENTATION=-